jgi:CheY-like chemotaxis protein
MYPEKLRILFVDDEEDDLIFFKEALEKLNIEYNLFNVQSCGEIFNEAKINGQFDIIFLDINMPVMDGKICLKELKASDKYKNVPVVIFTVSQSPEDIKEVYESGAHYYLIKPYAQLNFVAALKIIFSINWKGKPPVPSKNEFVINFSYN